MAHIIIDRRKNASGKSSVNRQRFVKRVKAQVKEAVRDVIRDGNISDVASEKGKKIKIPTKGLKQPTFHHDKGGVGDYILPGNDKFNTGDTVPRPEDGGGAGGRDGSPDGEGEDDFDFHLTREEFLEIFFEDLELPNLTKKDIAVVDEVTYKRAGFSCDGNPSRLNVVRSMKQAKGRRFALRSPKKKALKKLEAELELLNKKINEGRNSGNDVTIEKDRRDEVVRQIAVLKRKIKAVPFIDETDLRYNRWEQIPLPTTQAVMFCIMDVSASMGEFEKELSKRFFMLLYLFLFRQYERIEVVFIRHHVVAKEVDEDEFFHSRETGGTVVSPALEMMYKIIQERYPTSQWNIFGCQASDGDNWHNDTPNVQEELKRLLTVCQYYAYVEIGDHNKAASDLWTHLEDVKNAHGNFDMTTISEAVDIYPVFRKLFDKRT